MSPGIGRRGFGGRGFGRRGFGGGYRGYGSPQRTVGRLSPIDIGLILCAAVAFVAMFFSAFTYPLFGVSRFGWGFRGYWVAVFLLIAGAVIVYLRNFRASATMALPAGARPTTALAALIALVFAAIRTAVPPVQALNQAGGVALRADVAAGGWVVLGAVVVFTGLALYDLRRTGEKLPWQRGAGSSY